MLIASADVVHDQSLCMMEEENAAEHIGFAPIAHQLRTAAGIPDGDTEMVIIGTAIVRHPRLCAGKDKDT